MTSLSEWLAAFREAHERARTGALAAAERAEYRAARDELARVVLVCQQISREFGHSARQAMRVAWALQVDLELPGGAVRAVTLDLAKGGFSALLGRAPAGEALVPFALRLPGAEPLRGIARAVAVVPKPGNYRVSFAFAQASPADVERLEVFLVDKVLAQLAVAAEERAAG